MLDELVDVIETLKSRIDKHRSVLQGNEAQTRLSLIDPLLRALGWDTADPALVRPEYVVNGRRADYALMNAQGEVVVFLEAKNLGEQLANHRSQVVAYASELGIRFPALTNGNEWEVYDNSQLVPIEQRRVLNVSIANADSAKCALQFLLLWRPNLASGQPIEAKEPILGTEPPAPVIATPGETTAPTGLGAPDSGWITLREVNTEPDKNRPRPSVIRFPNREERRITIWLDFLREVTEWLIRDGALTPEKVPIPDRTFTDVYIVNSQPKHPGEVEFYRPHKLSNGLFLYTWGNAKMYVDRCITLLEICGKDPSTVHVQVG